MKNEKIVTIPVKDLVVNGVYLTHTKDLVQIMEINEETRQMKLRNMTEACHIWVDLDKHIIVERKR